MFVRAMSNGLVIVSFTYPLEVAFLVMDLMSQWPKKDERADKVTTTLIVISRGMVKPGN